MEIYLWDDDFIFFGNMPNSIIVRWYISPIFNLLGPAIYFYNYCTNLHSHKQYKNIPLIRIWPTHALFDFLLMATLNGLRQKLNVALVLSSLIINEVECLFIYRLVIYMSLYVYLPVFSLRLLLFFIFSCVIYSLDILSYWIYILQISLLSPLSSFRFCCLWFLCQIEKLTAKNNVRQFCPHLFSCLFDFEAWRTFG